MTGTKSANFGEKWASPPLKFFFLVILSGFVGWVQEVGKSHQMKGLGCFNKVGCCMATF